MPGKKPTNLAASVRQRLYNLARFQGEELQLVLGRYGVERLLYRLSHTPGGERFVLKGAVLFYAWEGAPHRPTRDVDFAASGDPSPQAITDLFKAVCKAKRAEEAFRIAWQLEPSRYGYCLGTALNFLGHFEDALPVLQPEAESLQPDAMSWFQAGVANEGLKNWRDAIEAFKRAVALEETYALAWFNLGGAYWNAGEVFAALETWESAVSRFPDHDLATRVREDFLGGEPPDPRWTNGE